MKAGTPEKLKFIKLQRALSESKRGTVGLLELLWAETAKNAMQGDIGKFSNEDIALLCDWQGPPDQLIDAMVQCGWLDECEQHRLVVHDWAEHCPTFVKGNLAKHHKEFAKITPKQPTNEVAKQPAKHVAKHVAKQLATPPSKLLPSQVKSSQANPLRNSEELRDECYSLESKPVKQTVDQNWFDQWWDAFGYKRDKDLAIKEFPDAIGDIAKTNGMTYPEAFRWLMDRTLAFVSSLPVDAKRKYGCRWLRYRNYNDELETLTVTKSELPPKFFPPQRKVVV